MRQKNATLSRTIVQDIAMWTFLIFSLLILNSSKVFGQCNCDDEQVITVSLGASEGFESYSANQAIPIGGRWSLYPAFGNYNPVAATVVSTPVNCGSRSLRFQYNGTNNVDMRYLIDSKRTSFKMFVPAGKGGTFALLSGNGQDIVLELGFGLSGICAVNNGESFSYPQGSWFRISIIRSGNTFQVFRNYDHVSTFGTITEVEYANFYADDPNEQFYIDKLCTYFGNGASVTCSNEYNPVCLNLSNIEVGSNGCYAQTSGYITSEFSFCGSNNDSPCTGATPISCGETINGTTIGENFKFYRPDFGSCLGGSNSNDFRAPDKVYSFNHTGGDAQIHLWTLTPNADLDIFLLSDCGAAWSDNPVIVINNVPPNTNNPNITCIARGISTIDGSGLDTEYIFVKNLPAGTYYIVVDGQHWQDAGQSNDVGSFKLSLHCNDLVCTNPSVLRCGDKLINESNSNGANNVSIYCGPSPNIAGSTLPLPPGAGCTGRERVYTFTPDVNGEVTVNVTGIGSSEDFDAFVFLSCDHTNCLAISTNGYGQSEVITFDGEAGREYIIVIDGYQETTGNYDIEIVCPSTVICEFCPVFVPSYSNCAGFENLNTGNLIPQASPQFTLFTSNNSSHQAQVVNAFAANGLKSVKFGNTSNIDYNISRTINSPTRLEWMMYIPSGKSGAWGLETNSPSLYAYIARYNNGTLTVGTPTQSSGEIQVATLQYPQNTWFKVSIILRPKVGNVNGSIEIFNNKQFVHKRTDFGSNLLTDLNFYTIANATNTDYHIDNICYQESNASAPCTQEYNPVCVNGQVYPNPCFASKAGYTENEWQLGDCTGDYCDGCLKCFKYIPKYGTPRAINFFSQYCDDDEPTNLRSSYTAEWTVSNNANVQYVDNTSSTSLNPVILFPSNGSYTVCYKLFFGGLLVYECCQTIVIGPCNGGPIAYFSATNNASNNTFTLNSSGSTNVSNIKWEFSDTGVQFISGNVNSTSPVISIPSGKCISVCLIISNGCGMSTYCLKLCRNNSGCSGTVPPVYITNQITPAVNDKTVTISLPNPGNNQATYSWKFGDGGTSSSQSINYTYPNYGNYIICVEIRIGCFIYCYCWCVHLNPCTPVFEPHDGMLTPRFGGNETTLQYTIESNNITIAPGQPWLMDDVPVTNSTGVANLIVTLPENRDYVICFPYLKPNGCLAYKCITIRGGNPFSCTSIGWKYVQNSGYQFNLPAGFSEISWTLDETGQNIGTSATSNFVLPVNPCGWRTISVRYFDGTRYWICCLRIYLCAPDDCFGNIYYGFSNDSGQFRLEESGATNISWYFDDAPNTILGTSGTITVPYPVNCITRWISVKFRDASGRWRICCRLVYFCNPFNCDLIKINYVDGSGYKFSLDQTYQNMSWIIDETSQSLGSGAESNFYPLPTTCAYRTVTVRFFVPGIGWRMCCYRFWWCNPNLCSDRINITPSGSNYILSTTSSFQNITWFRESTQLGDGNNLATTLPSSGTYKIYIRYYNPSDKCWYWCCKQSNPCTPVFEPHDGMLRPIFGGSETTLQYTIESNNITIAPGQPWLLDNVPVTNSTGASNLTIALPQDRDYVICFPYLKPNGCLAYKCITIRGGNPFACTNIGWKYVQNSGYQFSLPAGFSEISWTLDETGQSIGSSATSNFVPPVNPCGWRTISVRYFDGTRYWICCLRIYLCAPDDCFGNVYYGSSNDNAQFRLEEAGATNISWYFDDAPNTILGTADTITVPYPVNCIERWITVKYRDASGRWRVCCRLIWFCNPFNCNQIKVTYTEGSGFRFELDQTYQNMSWVIDETNQALGSGVQSNFYPISGTECFLRTATVRYRDALGRWWICCYRFWWCNPANCNDKITITPSGSNYILSTDNTAQNITWFRENVQLGTGNNLTTTLPSTGTYKIYIRYYNPSNKAWYWCCKSFTPGGNPNTLSVDIDDNICGGLNAEIEVPVRVKNYNNIAGLQLKIASSNNNIAEIIGVTNINSNSGLGNVDFAVVDKKLVLTYADAEKSLSDNAILFSVKVRLKGAVNSTANLNFEGDLKALDTNGLPVTVTGVQGSVCVSQTAMSVSGRITNTKDKGIVNANVIVTTGSNQVTTIKSDNTGQFTITDLMSGTNYKIKPNLTELLANGVDISDLFLMRRHMQGLSLFSSPYTYLAADLNVDKQIDISDLFLMRRIMQGLTTELPNNLPAWRFVPKSYSFPTTGNPLSGTIPDALEYNPLTTNQTNQHFTGVKYGDLDHSLISFNNPLIKNRSAADVELNIESLTAASGSTVTLEVKCKNFIKGEVLQLSMQWQTDKLQLVNVPSGADIVIPGTTTFDQTQLAQGKLGLFWETDNNSGGGTTLSDNSVVYRMKFKLVGSNNTTAKIENSPTPKPAKFLDVNFTEIPLKIGTGTVTISMTSATADENVDKLIRIYPNPSTGILSIESDFKDVKNIEIRGLDGKLIQMISELRDNTLDLTHLAPGSYILKGVTNNYPFAKKVVIVR